MNPRIGELIFLEQLAKRYKLPVPEFLAEPVSQSLLKEKLEQWGSGIVKPDVLAGKRGKAGSILKVDKVLDALKALQKARPGVRVLVLSMHPEDQYAMRALKAGALFA